MKYHKSLQIEAESASLANHPMKDLRRSFATPDSASPPSHRRIRSFGTASPSPLLGNLPANDDEKEKRERQRQRIMQMQQKTLNSPATPTDR